MKSRAFKKIIATLDSEYRHFLSENRIASIVSMEFHLDFPQTQKLMLEIKRDKIYKLFFGVKKVSSPDGYSYNHWFIRPAWKGQLEYIINHLS